MKRLSRFIATTLALGLVAGAGAALADQGNGVLASKQVEQGLVTMGGKTYRVTDGTVLEDKDGNAIAFAEIPTTEQGASNDDAAVWFETADSADVQDPVLHLLKFTGAVPR